jgi:hypothetical protein
MRLFLICTAKNILRFGKSIIECCVKDLAHTKLKKGSYRFWCCNLGKSVNLKGISAEIKIALKNIHTHIYICCVYICYCIDLSV